MRRWIAAALVLVPGCVPRSETVEVIAAPVEVSPAAEVQPAAVVSDAVAEVDSDEAELPVSAAHPGALRVAAGLMHSCAVSGGRVHCWGYNGHGELGDGTREDRRTPTAVVGLTDATAVAIGNWHTCALRTNGTVMCWGDATQGQVGDAKVGSRLRPVVVPGLVGVTEISAGGSGTCTLGQGGAVRCWGERYGDEDDEDVADDEMGSARPRVVAGVKGSAIAVGEGYACAVQQGRVWCWGRVPLPTGMQHAATPVVVPGVSGAVEVAAGDRHACARRRGGTVVCWGEGRDGQRGDGVRDAPLVPWVGHHRPPKEVVALGPAAVVGLNDAVRVAAGSDFACALRKGGEVLCWGADRDGQLGDGGSEPQARPVSVGIGPVADLSLGAAHACAALRDGTMWCWGYNEGGQADNGATLQRRAAYVAFVGEPKAPLTAVAAGGRHACAVAGGRVVCLGDNTFGQLGDGGWMTPTGPVFVSGMTDAVEVVVGERHSCARRSGGEVQCWGDDTYGQLGQPGEPVGEPRDEHGMGPAPAPANTRSRPTPVTVAGLSGVTQLVARGHATCGLGAAGQLRCWHGEGAQALRDEVALPRDTREVGLGAVHSCARRETGEVLCWGSNFYGRVGDGTKVDRPQPTLVKGVRDAIGLAVGLLHSCALRRGGEVVCWGSGFGGRLGDGTEEERASIVTVAGLRDAVAITAGEDHTCALRRGGEVGGEVGGKVGGKVVCWGTNSEGALGDGSMGTRLVPVPVAGLPRARSIAAGDQLSCALAAGGDVVHCWGRELKAPDVTRVWDVARRPVAVRGLP